MSAQHRRRWPGSFVVSMMLTTWLLVFATASEASSFLGDEVPCPISDVSGVTKKDYRFREATDRLKAQYNDNWQHHMAPALELMKEGVYSSSVISDIDFTLQRWPNHYIALQALTDYTKGGGDADKFVPISCYFSRAFRFAPDDANIPILFGIHSHRERNYGAAEKSWLFALDIDGSSMEAHYNLGLLYHRLERYDEALAHALVAYDLGYPLPGLRNKLARIGHWPKRDQ